MGNIDNAICEFCDIVCGTVFECLYRDNTDKCQFIAKLKADIKAEGWKSPEDCAKCVEVIRLANRSILESKVEGNIFLNPRKKELVWLCESCGRKCATKYSLLRHMALIHHAPKTLMRKSKDGVMYGQPWFE